MIVASRPGVAPPHQVWRFVAMLALCTLFSVGSAFAQSRKVEENATAIDQNRAMLTRLQNEAVFLGQRVNQLEALLEAEQKKVAAIAETEGQEAEAAAGMAADQLSSIQTEAIRLKSEVEALSAELRQKEVNRDTQLEEIQEQLTKTLEDVERFRAAAEKKIGDLASEAELVSSSARENQNHLDRFWVLIAAFLVFFMQAGFKALEAGMVRQAHADSVAVKNILDWLIVCVVFFGVGFGLMFGQSNGGWIGTTLFLPEAAQLESVSKSSAHGLGFEFFLFQLAFAGTAATIVSGAIAERTILSTYLILAVLTTIAYSVLGHWSWGSLYLDGQSGFLEGLGFHDFAGSTVVHSLGAWVALAAVIVIRPRTGRYADDGSIQYDRFKPNSLHYSAMGVFILWFGWFGFNGGSVLAFNSDVSAIIFNTSICAAVAGLTAFVHGWLASSAYQNVYPKLIGGVLGGLVAITACCDVVSQFQAVILGVIAGLVHNFAFDLMLRFRWDDVVGAVPVHGACGVAGTLWVAVGEESSRQMIHQLGIQAVGVSTVFVCTFFPFLIICIILDKLVGLRIGFMQERDGYVIGSRRDNSEEFY